ncbi:hypothetical protein Y032_1019g3407 [Ancylostoma ceylanicum]|uniref:Uncharacterized protein n=1 Tax=Ancylostoma ceylanicum TaxID=53326 RepID=A0A016W8J3_9BILA|nr:hypothetical protein Y032_1019g3407 [Ancylostoma ceylanicum]
MRAFWSICKEPLRPPSRSSSSGPSPSPSPSSAATATCRLAVVAAPPLTTRHLYSPPTVVHLWIKFLQLSLQKQ